MAFEKLPENEAVIHRVLSRALEVGLNAGVLALRELEPYVGTDGIFEKEQVVAFGLRKESEATEMYLSEKIAGRHNDKRSMRPGFTALVRGHVKRKIEKVFEANPQGSLLGAEITAVDDTDSEEKLFIVRLPEGGFEQISPITIEFTDIVEPVGQVDVRPTATASSSVRAATHDVVTIIGDAGEYWQNCDYTLDGTFKE